MKATKNKNLWIVPVYGIFYLIMFFVLENSSAVYHVIYSPLDDRIPFCEYFIIPYYLWFAYVAVTVAYFMFINVSSREYRQLISILGAGMSVFLIVSFVYPNCHHLRPTVTGDNLCSRLVLLLHAVDTPTNLLPSIHVFNSLACYAALMRNEPFRKRKGLVIGCGILTISIILSTMFLKQHSVVDVTLAFLFFAVSYWVFYIFMPENEKQLAKIFSRDQVLTVPNAFSFLRLILAISFWGISVRKNFQGKQMVLEMLLLSNIAIDFLDGLIVKNSHRNSRFGKGLHVIAGNVTQGVLLLYFVSRYPLLKFTVCLFLLKVISMLAVSPRMILAFPRYTGAVWCEKLNTAVFYGVMIILMKASKLDTQTVKQLVGICDFFMGLSFAGYLNLYMTEYQMARRKFRPAGMD